MDLFSENPPKVSEETSEKVGGPLSMEELSTEALL